MKHRWEHTPQWQEASKFVLSKHQQVQLLEVSPFFSPRQPRGFSPCTRGSSYFAPISGAS